MKCDGKREKNEFFFESGKRRIQTQINDVKACRTLRPTPPSLLNDACLHNDVFSNQTLVGGALCQKGRLFARNVNISGGPLSALTCCVNVRLLSGDKKNIAVNLFSKLGWELGLYYASYDDFHPDILARMYT